MMPPRVPYPCPRPRIYNVVRGGRSFSDVPEVDVMDDDAPEKLDELEELLAVGLDRLAEGRARQALELAETIEADDVAAVHELRALALTLLGRVDEADAALARAAELEPEDYFRPYRLDRPEFDAAVEKTLTELPDEFREYLQNVEVGVEDVPSPELIADGLEFDLLGVYIGATADADDWGFPDRVVLFQRNLENISPDRETLLAEIRDTLLHEVGHHFGMDEDTLRALEQASED